MKENSEIAIEECTPNELAEADDLQQSDESIWEFLRKNAPVSAAKHMPLEMWGEVFRFTVKDGDYITPSISQPPLSLAHVCRGWRWMAHSIPALWSSAHIGGSYRQFNGHTQLIHMWFKRSRGLPLFISIDAGDLHDAEENRVGTSRKPGPYDYLPSRLKLPALWGFHSTRMQNLQLRIPSSLLETLLNNPNAPLSSVERLSLHILEKRTVVRSAMHHTPSFIISDSATRLHILDLWVGNMRNVFPLDIDLGWDRLTRFTSSSPMQLHQCHDLIRNCVNLESCYLGNVMLADDGLFPFLPTTLPHLRSLILHLRSRSVDEYWPDADVEPLLDCLTLPTLSNLELIFNTKSKQDSMEQIVSLLNRSSCPIKRLVYHRNGVRLSEMEIASLLRRFASLIDVNNKGQDLLKASPVADRTSADLNDYRDLPKSSKSKTVIELPIFPLPSLDQFAEQKESLGFLH